MTNELLWKNNNYEQKGDNFKLEDSLYLSMATHLHMYNKYASLKFFPRNRLNYGWEEMPSKLSTFIQQYIKQWKQQQSKKDPTHQETQCSNRNSTWIERLSINYNNKIKGQCDREESWHCAAKMDGEEQLATWYTQNSGNAMPFLCDASS